MSLPPLPLLLLLILPGFLFIYAGFLVSRFRKLDAFQGTAWSLVIGILLVVGIYSLYAGIIEPPSGRPWPGLLEILGNPALVPGPVWVVLYGSALALGLLFGWVYKKGIIERVLIHVGIDLRRHGGVWGRLFREAWYVQVYLTDGSLLFGWPEYYSSDRSEPGPELYLTQVRIWDAEQSKWVETEGVRGVLVDASRINRIEFLEVPVENQNAKEVQ